MAGCGTPVEVWVPKGWHGKLVTLKCGNTLPTGYPAQCPSCEEANKDRDWRQEAMDAGEAWGEDDY